jgi:hypothetical protein
MGVSMLCQLRSFGVLPDKGPRTAGRKAPNYPGFRGGLSRSMPGFSF